MILHVSDATKKILDKNDEKELLTFALAVNFASKLHVVRHILEQDRNPTETTVRSALTSFFWNGFRSVHGWY